MAKVARDATLRASVAALVDQPSADVLIIGGGINGIATAWDLSLQGVKVALVERNDFVSGASSASSHMVHGGIRYLENGEFRLVHEAVVERNALIRTAPHYVRPLRTTIPIFKTFSGILRAPWRLLVSHGTGKPSERGALLIKVGLMIYDTFSRAGGTVPRHVMRNRWETLAEFAQMNPRTLWTATYYDASMHSPERLALDVLHDAEKAGARAANYVAAVGRVGDKVLLRDAESGTEFEFGAKLIINTSGPQTDLTNDALGAPTHFMGGTKGSHIVLNHPELLEATHGNEIFFEHSDGRIVLIYPLNGRVMIGTTDIEADPSKPVVCTDDEIDYFFDLVHHVFPFIKLDREHIVYTFAGIRPLPNHGDLPPGFVSRDYRIESGKLGKTPTLSLVGGKWTTFRASAEHLSSDALALLRKQRKVTTQGRAIGGGVDYPTTPMARADWITAHRGAHTDAFTDRMLERYGTRAAELLPLIPASESDCAHLPGYTPTELQLLAEREQTAHLIDLLLRRTSLAFVGGLSRAGLREAATAMAKAHGWTAARTTREIDAAITELRERHLVDIDSNAIGG